MSRHRIRARRIPARNRPNFTCPSPRRISSANMSARARRIRRSTRSAARAGTRRRSRRNAPCAMSPPNCCASRPCAKRSPATRSRRTRPGSANLKARSFTRKPPDQVRAIAETKSDMERAQADGPPDLRRRRFRQNGSRHSRRVQGRDGRQTGCHPRADDRAGAAAFQHVPRAHGGLSDPRRTALALPHAARTASASSRIWPTGAVDIVIGTHRLVAGRHRVQGPRPGRD